MADEQALPSKNGCLHEIAQSLDWTIRNLNTALLLRCPAWDTPRGASTPTPSPCPDPNRGHRPPPMVAAPPQLRRTLAAQRTLPYMPVSRSIYA
ncbi:MAG: hypothetical protein U1U88_001415 [Lawsonella clevelandensis]